MSFLDEDEIADDVIGPVAQTGATASGTASMGTIIEATLSHRRGILGALTSGGFAVAGRAKREDLLQAPEGGDASG